MPTFVMKVIFNSQVWSCAWSDGKEEDDSLALYQAYGPGHHYQSLQCALCFDVYCCCMYCCLPFLLFWNTGTQFVCLGIAGCCAAACVSKGVRHGAGSHQSWHPPSHLFCRALSQPLKPRKEGTVLVSNHPFSQNSSCKAYILHHSYNMNYNIIVKNTGLSTRHTIPHGKRGKPRNLQNPAFKRQIPSVIYQMP